MTSADDAKGIKVDSSRLVQKIREWVPPNSIYEATCRILDEAANTIEKLERELAEARDGCKKLRADLLHCASIVDEGSYGKLADERDRYREALKFYAEGGCGMPEDIETLRKEDWPPIIMDFDGLVARKALEGRRG